MDAAGDEAALEGELEAHLEENRASLLAVDEALAADVDNPELITIREELHQAVKGAEESLLHLKRARLLREVEALAQPQEEEALAQPQEEEALAQPQEEEPVETVSAEAFAVSSKCRFRHSDGRWYNGCILGMESDSVARVAFLHPTSDKMQMCRFFLQQQCRFGAKCRLSHGIEVRLDVLRNYEPPEWNDIELGSAVLAEAGNGLWKAAELESWTEGQQYASIVVSADGKRMDVFKDDLAVSEYAEASDDSEEEEEEESEDEDDVEESFSGVQTETITFAHWERHTRGVASKMMANMGFREGMGLGKAGQGITVPVKVQMRPLKQSLGYEAEEQTDLMKKKKKKTRGGKRKRDQKWAAAQRAAKSKMEIMEETNNVFDFINHQLATDTKATTKHAPTPESGKQANRQSIVAHEDEIKILRSKVSKLQEMATRNRKEKAVFEAVDRKLVEARKALASAEAAHSTTMHAVHSKEKERKWLRF